MKDLDYFFPLCSQVLFISLFSVFLHALFKFRKEQHVLPLFQHSSLLVRPNAAQETGDVSPLKTSNLPLTEGEFSLLQGRGGKVSFNYMGGKQPQQPTVTFCNYISHLTLTSYTTTGKLLQDMKKIACLYQWLLLNEDNPLGLCKP